MKIDLSRQDVVYLLAALDTLADHGPMGEIYADIRGRLVALVIEASTAEDNVNTAKMRKVLGG